MNEKVKGVGAKLKDFWGKLSSGVRKLLIIGLCVLVAAAVGLTIWLNMRNSGYIVLFPDMEASESAEVYQYLQSEGVSTQMNTKGEIMVPETQWDTLVYELAAKGYPKSAPSYGTYFDNLSMTMTDSEKEQLIIKDLQDRLQETINRIDGVKGSVVTISYPESSSYAWKENNDKASASVTLTLEDADSFTSKNVSAIKNLVAFSAQAMEPDAVTVIDTTTGNELGSTNSSDDSYEINSRENYEKIIRQRIEESVESVLSKPYGDGNVVAACSVTVNYDKITEEMLKYLTNDDGEGVVDWRHIIYNGNDGDGTTTEGVTGEENNTDVPSYPNEDEDIIANDPDYVEREITYSIGHVLTQTEKAQGVITDSSIAITVKTSLPLSQAEKDEVVSLVRNATGITDTTKITVFDWQGNEDANASAAESNGTGSIRDYLWIALIIVLGVVGLTIAIVLLVNRNAKKKIKDAEEKNKKTVSQLEEKLEDTQRRSLIEMANETNKAQKETASEVKKFAQDNPDLTAAIIRSMIKEDEAKAQKEEEEDDEF